MTATPKLPTGETLPEYDDEHPEGVDIDKIVATLRGGLPVTFAKWGYNCDPAVVRDVLRALQAVGDATLVKNGTYRMMRRDSVDIEHLAAYLTREGYAGPLVEHDGNPVKTIIAVIGTDG